MADIVDFIRLLTPAVLVFVFAALLVLESAFPLRVRCRKLLGRYATNLCISGLAFMAGFFTVRAAATYVAAWTSSQQFGLLNLLRLPTAFQICLGFVLMDVTFYYWHRLMHRIGLFWRLHQVHHIDPDMDVTTSFRFHFGEILASTAFRVLQVGLLGIAPATYLIYELVFQVVTLCHHSNVRLPISAERLLNKVFVTPRMHGVHHSVIADEVNANYSVVFRWWDALHGTLRLNVPQLQITIGVAGYHGDGDNSLLMLLATPFRRQRPGTAAASRTYDDDALTARRGYMLQ